MALIACPECSHQVSDKAPACIRCGAPIATRSQVRSIGASTVVQEQTAKQLKFQYLISVSACFIGVLGGLVIDGPAWIVVALWLLAGAGAICTLVIRGLMWWHHG